tara:strand:+ start:2507 stop:2815 length:309 start_codon:yes stop_codon:yes gene_type:complete
MDRTQHENDTIIDIDDFNSNGFNSNDLLDMSNHLKSIYERDKKKLNGYIKRHNFLYEQLMIIYGLIKCYQTNDADYNYDICIAEVDTICSDILLKHLEDIED